MNERETGLWGGHLDRSPWQEERRRAPRHPSREERSWIGWWDGQNFNVIAVRLLDIGQGGVALETGTPGPKVGDEIVLRLDKSRPDQIAEAEVVGRSVSPSGETLLHLRFLSGCPPHLFLAAVHGLPEQGPRSN